MQTYQEDGRTPPPLHPHHLRAKSVSVNLLPSLRLRVVAFISHISRPTCNWRLAALFPTIALQHDEISDRDSLYLQVLVCFLSARKAFLSHFIPFQCDKTLIWKHSFYTYLLLVRGLCKVFVHNFLPSLLFHVLLIHLISTAQAAILIQIFPM